ncbi:MAG: hypothetical protein K6G09_12590 [Treponema sp.]|nr:hypothetical protein [Treponema sp.]
MDKNHSVLSGKNLSACKKNLSTCRENLFKGKETIPHKKFVLLQILFFIPMISLFAQTPSFLEKIRIQLWADLDVYPEYAADFAESKESEDSQESQAKNGIFTYPINQIKDTAPFLINGMLYGWDFIYTPSDKARGVEEYFELIEIQPSSMIKNQIAYSSPLVEIEKNQFSCWCEYVRTSAQIQNYKMWSTITNPIIRARGYGPVDKGFEGIKLAAQDAMKTAVREYYRGKIKNKPKEITGSVLIRSEPLLGIDSGRYAINLDFFLECGRIKEYTSF